MNNKWLWMAFAGLLALFIASKLFDKKPQRSFNPQFVELAANQIDKIVVHPKEGVGETFTLSKSGDNWMVSNASAEAPALKAAVDGMIETMTSMRAKRVVSKSTEKWAFYEVDETKGKKIELFSSGKKAEELILGRFDFNQQTKSAKSYVRHMNDNNVYLVDGFLSMTLGQNMDAFRNKEILKLDKDQITRVELETSNRQFAWRKENTWVDANNQVVDSTLVDNYLDKLLQVNGNAFIDNYQPAAAYVGQLTLEFADGREPVKVKSFASSDAANYVIHSTMNPSAYFQSDTAGVYQVLFGK